MPQRPSKLAAASLLVVGFGGLLAWFTAPALFPDRKPVLTDFVTALNERARDLEPAGRLPSPLPQLAAGQAIVVVATPSATALRAEAGLSKRALATIARDLQADGPDLTVLYLVSDGEVRARERISRCNLTLAVGDSAIITQAKRTAYLDCGPLASEPGECRDIVGLWNERCTARLVLP